MSNEYRVISGPKGKRYLKNNKLVSVKNVPKDVLKNLTEGSIVSEAGIKPTPNSRPCIFCGKWGNKPTFINGDTIYRCDEDYLNKTIGQVAEQLRKDSNGKIQSGDVENKVPSNV